MLLELVRADLQTGHEAYDEPRSRAWRLDALKNLAARLLGFELEP
ncbi:hypothetical protein [Deinococcus hopiensis]|nr:hypothetical protein [Deinococcus hopiensis]